jgi:hypothetical protein
MGLLFVTQAESHGWSSGLDFAHQLLRYPHIFLARPRYLWWFAWILLYISLFWLLLCYVKLFPPPFLICDWVGN